MAALVAGTTAYTRGARPATCLPDGCFCEAVRTQGLAQPVNAVTSLAYVLLGVYGLLALAATRRVADPGTRRLVAVAAVAVALVGPASMYYHGTLTFLGQFLDVLSMYLVGLVVLAGALWRRGSLRPRTAAALVLVLLLALAAAQYAWPESRRVLFALVLLPGVLLETRSGTTGVASGDRSMRHLRLGLALLTVAYAVWLADDAGLLCWPTSPVQGHGLWHVLTAVAAALVLWHYAATPGGRGDRRTAARP